MAPIDGSTIIGESILISGSLNGDEDLTVRGRVEGTLTLTKTLVVEPTGIEGRIGDAVIGGQADDEQAAQAALAQVSRQARGSLTVVLEEGGIRVDFAVLSLADH